MSTDSATIGTVELHHVFLNATLADNVPEFHCRFAGKRDEVCRQVVKVLRAEYSFENLFGFNLFDHSAVLVEGEGSHSFFPLTIEELLNRHNPLVVLSVVVESHGSFEADKALSEIEHTGTSLKLLSVSENIAQSLPTTTARIALVGLDVSGVLKVTTVLVNKIPDETVNVVLAPG